MIQKKLQQKTVSKLPVNPKEARFVDVFFITKGYLPNATPDQDMLAKPQLQCKGVVYTGEGALAIDGKCWKKVQTAYDKGEVVYTVVNLAPFGTYGSVEGTFEENPYTGPIYGDYFYYTPDITGELLDNGPESVFKPVKENDKVVYFTYRRVMAKEGTQVKNAIRKMYQNKQWKDLTDAQLKAYFKTTTQPKQTEQSVSDNLL